jgi:hypothetical protein
MWWHAEYHAEQGAAAREAVDEDDWTGRVDCGSRQL